MADEQLLPIVQAGDPVLRVPARELASAEFGTPELDEFIARMIATMRAAPGVGLAAPQVGVPIKLAVIEDRPEYLARSTPDELAARERQPVALHVIANPRITVVDATPAVFYEGCLSVDGWMAVVARASGVHVDALDQRGQPIAIDARGWYARILQHEIDHLHG